MFNQKLLEQLLGALDSFHLITFTWKQAGKNLKTEEKNINVFNFTTNLTPHYISCLVPQAFENIHDYNTRNASALPVVRTRTSLYYNSFIPSSVRLWNLQPDTIRLSPSIQALKYSLKSNISSKPFYYYTGSHLGQILHSRLRMQCSSLNQHLYRKNIVDSPNCICGLTESTTHYLFHCLRYTAQRQMHIPIDLTTEILLFGSPKLAPNQNVELFLAVQFVLSVVSDSLLKVF